KTCAICIGTVETWQGQAIFTAACSYSFHFGCISNSVTHGNYLCLFVMLHGMPTIIKSCTFQY
ncbi:hypothetical protein Pfo_018567, partial [Paulownia fortunei]